ncbi:hypothetical protein CJF32_00003416 [Rutstroemia sp. NJR-2017a WRK4]|nr:hypothetical protein CJF32_00003416 [Rutstroemia sp. NJR-2017a WRK4]
MHQTSSAFGVTDRRKDIGYSLPQLNSAGYIEAPVKAGLRTPPEDEMNTTYQPPTYNNYNSRQDVPYAPRQATFCSQSRSNDYSGVVAPPRQSVSLIHHSTHSSETSNIRDAPSQPSQSYSYSNPQSPQVSRVVKEESHSRKGSTSDMIQPNLQIPASINNSGGSLAEFAAQITCLFWFESTEMLQKAEELGADPSLPVQRLRDEAIPSSGFRKWVVTILLTTQVTQNVILLALLFIYRLKTINPAVKGRSGSEYRLLTVALMLGNKFLDDNTYTNKTWAEVSGISVTEIHVMEVEFLSNMRYSLLASKDQWNDWQKKLSKFWSFCDRAAKAPLSLPSPVAAPTYNNNLPSPPTSMLPSPPSLSNSYPPSNGSYGYSPQWSSNNSTAQLVSPLTNLAPEQDFRLNARKRSLVDDMEEPAAKRVTRSTTTTPSAASTYNSSIPPRPRLPVPNLTISTSQAMHNGYNGVTSFPQNAPLLPPLNGRSMATVFPTTPTWTPPVSNTPTGPPSQPGTQSLSQYGTPSRRHSPRSVQDLLSFVPSPINASFPSQNPGHISPSIFYQQRNSPYKPVRHVNTLLYPPPSASMHDYSANANQMRYQPLGKRHDYRPGVVPEYGNHYQQWPVLPQPNFHT